MVKEYRDADASVMKDQVNKWLCETLEPYHLFDRFGNLGSVAFVLDASSLKSSRALLLSGIVPSPDKILVPNPFEYQKLVAEIEKDPSIQGIQALDEYSGHVLAHSTPHRFVLVYLDYTCTLTGCKRVRPKRELAIMFQRNLFSTNKAFLALTFHVPQTYEDPERVKDETLSFLSQCATESGHFSVSLLFSRVYKNISSRMMFAVFLIEDRST